MQIEGEMCILKEILLIQLSLSNLNHDTLNLKLGPQQMSQTQVSPLIIPSDVMLHMCWRDTLLPRCSVFFKMFLLIRELYIAVVVFINSLYLDGAG